jgi:hypothetical protein
VSAPGTPAPRPEAYQVPSLGYRILAGGGRLVPLLVVLVGIPVAGLEYLAAHQVSLPISIVTVAGYGVAISVLSTARYVAKPTRAYGPLSMATSVVAFSYLFTLWLQATYRISVPNSAMTISIGYVELVDLLLLVPALALVAGLISSVEDLRSPTERLPFDFPP